MSDVQAIRFFLMDSLPHLRLPSMMSSKNAREWQVLAETTTVRTLKELKISPIIDYVVKPNPVFAQQWFNVMFVTTTYYLFCQCEFFSPTQYLFVGYYIARNANEKMPSILHIRRRKWMKRSFVLDGAALKEANFANLCSQVMFLVVTILFTPFVERRRYKYTGPNRVKT